MADQHRQTQREALIVEALGDAWEILKRFDQLKEEVPAMAQGVTADARKACEAAREDIEGARARLTRDLEAYTNTAQGELVAAAQRMEAAAADLAKQQRRAATLALVAGLAGGVLAFSLLGVVAAVLAL